MAEFEDTNQFELPHMEVDWSLLFQPSEWYITPETLRLHGKSLLISAGFSLFCALVYILARSKGINKKGFWGEMRFGRLRFSDSLQLLLWLLCYIPLTVSAWLVYIESESVWTRALTIYTLHMVVNVAFSISLWWIQDISLALLNLLTLIGVAMYTTSQFGKILYFASYINTPYLLFLLVYFLEFCYFWYLNEGQELMDIANLQAAKTVSVLQANNNNNHHGHQHGPGGCCKPDSPTPSNKPKKTAGPPDSIKQLLQARLKKQQEALKKNA